MEDVCLTCTWVYFARECIGEIMRYFRARDEEVHTSIRARNGDDFALELNSLNMLCL